jgi:hypothetical protein
MKMKRAKLNSALLLILTVVVMLMASRRLPAQSGACGGTPVMLPFNDVAGNPFFCQIAEAFFTGLTNGTTPTTYSPSQNVPREQMAAFITRTQDSALRRGSRRAALGQWATQTTNTVFVQPGVIGNLTPAGNNPIQVKSDGLNLYITNRSANSVTWVRLSDGAIQFTYTNITGAATLLIARSMLWVATDTTPGVLYAIMGNNNVNAVATNLGNRPQDITTDGAYIWTANFGGQASGSVSRIPARTPTDGATNFNGGFTHPMGILFDGTFIWVSDFGDNTLKRLDLNGNFAQVVEVGAGPSQPVFDGSNIWVPNKSSNSVTVVRARDGLVLATLTGNGLNGPNQAAFDGERILVTNFDGDSVSLWKAADLAPIGTFPVQAPLGASPKPFGACSDGINFWVTMSNSGLLARF